jgi:hypothetical protein
MLLISNFHILPLNIPLCDCTALLALSGSDAYFVAIEDGTSKSSHHHAVAILQLAQSLLQFGIKPGNLMVIAMYKS